MKNETGRVYGMYGGTERPAAFWLAIMKRGDHLEDLGLDGGSDCNRH
jgi:hypothetical protein